MGDPIEVTARCMSPVKIFYLNNEQMQQVRA